MEGGGSTKRGLGGTGSFSNPLWEELRDDLPKTLSGAFAWSTPRLNIARSGEAEYVNGVMASGGYFTTLGVSAILGRTFTAGRQAGRRPGRNGRRDQLRLLGRSSMPRIPA